MTWTNDDMVTPEEDAMIESKPDIYDERAADLMRHIICPGEIAKQLIAQGLRQCAEESEAKGYAKGVEDAANWLYLAPDTIRALYTALKPTQEPQL